MKTTLTTEDMGRLNHSVTESKGMATDLSGKMYLLDVL